MKKINVNAEGMNFLTHFLVTHSCSDIAEKLRRCSKDNTKTKRLLRSYIKEIEQNFAQGKGAYCTVYLNSIHGVFNLFIPSEGYDEII